MRYISTRGQAPPVSFLDAVLAGMAPDGGLYVPESWPALDAQTLARISEMTYADVAAEVLAVFAGDDLSSEEINAIVTEAYARDHFDAPQVTPLRQLEGDLWVQELFHGPSLSFKDMAMQMLGPLYERALHKRGERLTIVCATSGDTGGAAVEALKNRDLLDLFVLTPRGRVSDVQRLFMTASGAQNVRALEIDGDFDACQSVVKALFADRAFAQRAHLSAVNSINWARIVAQSVYYVVSAAALSGRGPVNYVVPSGNFGDAFSGYVARRLGAPIGAIKAATNENDILANAIMHGRYQRAENSVPTISPAMDIQVASNFERLLFEAVERDGAVVAACYEEFARTGRFDLTKRASEFIFEAEFDAAAAYGSDGGFEEITDQWERHKYLICPHTAVAFNVIGNATGRLEEDYPGHHVVLATAHPAKFPDTVERATGVRPQLPAKCADLFQRSEKFDSLPADAEAVKQYIRERSRAWS